MAVPPVSKKKTPSRARVLECVEEIHDLVERERVVRTKADIAAKIRVSRKLVELALKELRARPDGVKYRRRTPVGYVLKGYDPVHSLAERVQEKKTPNPLVTRRTGSKGEKVGVLRDEKSTLWRETTSGTLPETSFDVIEKHPDEETGNINHLLDKIKQQFLDTCPRCASKMKKTFIIIGGDRRILVNQCRVCKFYLPA